nr:putative BPI/LBP family protein At1g04970 [Ipomoea batatas]GME01042.1 putative BPI/LBP family protein At1g04970 [Ipomoea batatas]
MLCLHVVSILVWRYSYKTWLLSRMKEKHLFRVVDAFEGKYLVSAVEDVVSTRIGDGVVKLNSFLKALRQQELGLRKLGMTA